MLPAAELEPIPTVWPPVPLVLPILIAVALALLATAPIFIVLSLAVVPRLISADDAEA